MYSIFLRMAMCFAWLLGPWNEKYRLFVNGHRGLMSRIKKAVEGYDNIIWFHTSSYGDFEEARPIVDATRARYPDRKILLTFFSPAGYEARKTYKSVDWVFYLPLDTMINARRFVKIVRPSKAIFTLGEYWFNFLHELHVKNVDTYVMSVRILNKSPYLKWYGLPYRILFRNAYNDILVKDENTVRLLKGIGVSHVTRVGDARFDRVVDIAAEPFHNEVIETWNLGKKVFIAGSTCPGGDDDLVISLANNHPSDKFLFIPHEIEDEPIKHIVESVKGGAVVYSDVENSVEASKDLLEKSQVLVINKVGMLSKLYRYGYASLVGGAFINMPHSVIEPAVYGLPVVMGPQYERDLHFVDLKNMGAGISVKTPEEINAWYDRIHSDPDYLAKIGQLALDYCETNKGATNTIMKIIFGE